MPRIFDRYWQARSSKTLGAELGLYRAKGIVEQHGSTLEAANPPGSGAILTFTLPLRP